MTHNVHTCSKANCKHTMSNRNKNYANKLLRKDQHTHNLKKFQSLQWQWKASAVYGNGKVQV